MSLPIIIKVYARSCIGDGHGRSVTMQSISSSLKVIDFSKSLNVN